MNTKTPGPNLTVIFLAVAFVVGCGIAGGVVLTVADKDASSFYGFFTATLATVVAFGTLARSQGKITESVEEVRANVNGRLSRLIELATENPHTRSSVKEARNIGIASGVITLPDGVDGE